MITTNGYAAQKGEHTVSPFTFERDPPKGNEMLIQVLYCGICHSDLELLENNWGITKYPCVPGHEAAGRVTSIGPEVTKFAVGDIVGVGCMIDSCLQCQACKEGWENHCEGPNGPTMTYSGYLSPGDKEAAEYNTFGAWSDNLVVREEFVVKIPENMPLEEAAPLMCPGTDTFGPMRRFGDLSGKRIAILGLGGPGHMALQFAKAMGAEYVAVVSTHAAKRDAAFQLGADEFIVSTDADQMRSFAKSFHHILSTIPVPFDLAHYLALLRRRGTITVMGLLGPYKSILNNIDLAARGLSLTGSMIGSVAETKEVLDFCQKHSISPLVEVIDKKDINQALERLRVADVRFRFVIKIAE
ncbi:zinc-containing alcohol dehydrogenase superfamily protein [Rhizodiscina lignyota]|uniref:Zinc-containing alcohol dehydrogenase superfamily protein n=1 Tax=Rhizodiscina lignyota TaxID=1504668 RepID=A0A9P4IPN3_9PEZI|nr:zinc-containing alcohol dehydrogenase superfamily protein [Rhizodiscina lignyota]